MLDGGLFGLYSVDLAGYSGILLDFTVHFIGYRPDGSTVSALFSGSGLNFQTFYFGPEFSGLARGEIPTIGWSLDNLVVAVPEPGAWALLSVGGLLLWTLRRHREKRW
ncbi:MAG TPA: PEP-CTERM sorting domain-containing protein [Verrucomicrobiota bacterium]|nr:PEP-CTERM sorting domain-containing protein [Verrucomicrobiota bacterium]HQB16676.1 PEP-CTERM sorting domain-containing protein [Verrucomicrobiota bacterium]